MEQKRFELIIKCLELSNSDQEGEALNAIRKANKILHDEKLTWREFFKIPKVAQAPVQKPQPQPPQQQPNRGYSPFEAAQKMARQANAFYHQAYYQQQQANHQYQQYPGERPKNDGTPRQEHKTDKTSYDDLLKNAKDNLNNHKD